MGRRFGRRPAALVAAVLVVDGVVAGGLHLAKATYAKSACQVNLHQIGRAILLYADRHGGRYPDGLGDTLGADDLSPAAFVCPASGDEAAPGPSTRAAVADLAAGRRLSYVYVGRAMTEQTATPTTVVAYEPLANHGDGGNVLYGDGHVAWVGKDELARVAATTQPAP